ncbi:16S rRNA (guanine(527)-N(7))-methyltransferase RsmG [Cognatishimia sp. SS12]|uniref:16S rRNA (guanine(527)-N(7))-methyltransferase RsmG n=1 Tax=Cognatishimia sp. SS12 TaxID=2979465 RepID=UPI00232B98EB|nr:16S rRNA (guanine(527)-N(7))-methyltransferase RsmG [Cognatishimia sp. SS12]MDC0737737.1 16S rRNA (guanine(527)-N(7))-methyltransferase RsmG [Cognatishimia sp. SS12]
MNGRSSVIRALGDVSRETIERLDTYAELLIKWNPTVNLVSKSTLKDVWMRHMLDSVEIFQYAAPEAGRWVDLGSGGGFPGLVVAILSQAEKPELSVSLVESDVRKCAFMRTILRETDTEAKIYTDRIEQLSPLQADFLSARALADLAKLFEFSERHMAKDGIALFPKGITWRSEVQDAKVAWSFECESRNSCTQEGSVILKIRDIERV